jgi:hypothetical protein
MSIPISAGISSTRHRIESSDSQAYKVNHPEGIVHLYPLKNGLFYMIQHNGENGIIRYSRSGKHVMLISDRCVPVSGLNEIRVSQSIGNCFVLKQMLGG